MKGLIAGVVCVIGAAAALWAADADPVHPTLPDGGMERVRDGALVHWHVVGTPPRGAPADNRVRHAGAHSLRLHLAKSGRVRADSDVFALKGRTPYRLHLWTRGPWGVRFSVHLNEIAPDGSSHRRPIWPIEGVAFPPVWEESAIPFITRAGVCRGQIRVELFGHNLTEPKTFWVDDVRLEKRGPVRFRTSRRANLCYNPGMEFLNEAGTMPVGWGGWFASSKRLRACTQTGAAHSGRVCLESPLAKRGRVIVTATRVDVRAPAYCRVRIWAKGDGTVRLGLARYGPVWYRRLDVVFGPARKLTKDWQPLVWDVPVDLPETVAAIPVFDCQGHVLLDDARVELLP